MHGKWAIKGNTNCTDWKERPGTGCVRYDKTGDAATVIDDASGQIRAKIVKTAPGTPSWLPDGASVEVQFRGNAIR